MRFNSCHAFVPGHHGEIGDFAETGAERIHLACRGALGSIKRKRKSDDNSFSLTLGRDTRYVCGVIGPGGLNCLDRCRDRAGRVDYGESDSGFTVVDS